MTLADRREMTATVVGADPKSDVAVLRLRGSGFPTVAFGDSSRTQVAEVVLAIGNPFGLTQTVTMGIVSAVSRANLGIADYEDFIQTDAAINPGNSGGALVNARAQLIGLNTAIFSQSGGSMGIGFAVPANMVRQVMEQLIATGRVTRSYLGVSVQDLTPALARGLGVSAPGGVLVADVAPDSPAARAGLKRGDIVTAVDGTPVSDAGHFRNVVAATPPGKPLRLTVLREGREQTVQATVAEAPDRGARAAPAASRFAVPGEPPGMNVAELTPELARRLRLAPATPGVVVTDVSPSGAAAEAGLRPGDVIQEVNRRPVRSSRDFARALQQAGDADLVLLVNRGGATAYVAIDRS